MIVIIIVVIVIAFIVFSSGKNNSSNTTSTNRNNEINIQNDRSSTPAIKTHPNQETTSYQRNKIATRPYSYSILSSPSATKPFSSLSCPGNEPFPFMSGTFLFQDLVESLKAKYHLVASDNRQLVAEVNNHLISFNHSDHSYTVDGTPVPSITQVMKEYGPNIYSDVPQSVLNKAAVKGTAMHEAIERYEAYGTYSPMPELDGYKTLKNKYMISPIGMEIMVVISDENNKPLCAGRLDFLLFTPGSNTYLSIMDLKRTSAYHAANVATQLNLYKIGFEQCFGLEIGDLICLRLRETIAEYHKVKVGDAMANYIINCLRIEK